MRMVALFDSTLPSVFDGNKGQCFIMNLRSSNSGARLRNIASGVLYTFVFHQDQNGGHLFEWPTACCNATVVDPTPNATTVQNFIGGDGGLLYANLPGTRSQGGTK